MGSRDLGPDRASQVVGALAHVPDAVAALVPDVAAGDVFRGEPRADCSSCVKLPAAPEPPGSLLPVHPWAFHPHTRCCTYHPELPNFLAGRALLRGGPGAGAVRARLRDGSGVSAWGIVPPATYRDRRAATTAGFGRDPDLRCPFYVDGPHTCGIWKDRTGVCRSWFCKHDHGLAALRRWTALKKLLTAIERGLAELCVAAGQPPHRQGEPDAGAGVEPARWEAWFSWCAEHVERLSPDEVAALDRDGEIAGLRRALVASARLPAPDLGDVVVPVIRSVTKTPRGIGLVGYSPYDGVEVEPAIIHFFAQLDGRRTWHEALERAAGRCEPMVDEGLVRELHRIDILQPPARVMDEAIQRGLRLPPEPGTPVPEILAPAMQQPIFAGEHVWLQGEAPLASVIAPTSIFWFLSRLDGHTPWREVLGRMHDEHARPIEPDLVTQLYRIGALRAPDAA